MDGTKANKELFEFTEDDDELLIRIVKTSQARRVRGSKGSWKEFLKATDKELGSSVSDPAKRSWETLASFVQTFTAEDDIEMVMEIRQSAKRAKVVEQIGSEGNGRECPAQALVWLTHQHQRYQKAYCFPSDTEGWVHIDLGNGDAANFVDRMLSMDCEMVDCEHGEKEVVRVCVVDCECKMVLDMLVKPIKPVVDYLTPITGISEADLENVECDFYDAQRAVLNLLNPHTILVGHSLHNDLEALKIDHRRVIDTAFIFKYRNKPGSYRAGLNDLCKAVLGYEFREDGKPHDCFVDALIPMQIVLHTLEHGLNGPIDIAMKKLDEGQLCKLFFHGIPNLVSVDDLQEILPKEISCEIKAISWIKKKAGTTYAVFRSSDEANRAFKKLKGQLGKDSYGRPQKTVSISVFSGLGKLVHASFKVRKMSDDSENHEGRGSKMEKNVKTLHGSQRKRIFEVDDSSITEKLVDSMRTQKKERSIEMVSELDLESEECNCNHLQELEILKRDHLQEVETLKRKIRDQEVEIQTLQRIMMDRS